MSAACAVCNGEGAYGVRERQERGNVVMESFSTEPCACRSRLPPREGKAAWWTMETAHSATVAIPIGNESVEIAVKPEVPMSGDNYRVVRRGNRYYPTTVDVEIGRESLMMHPETARELAVALIAAADAADAIDKPDTDVCGHWAPCECGIQQNGSEDRA